MHNIIVQAQEMGMDVVEIVESLDFLIFFLKNTIYSNNRVVSQQTPTISSVADINLQNPPLERPISPLITQQDPKSPDRVSARVEVQNELKRLFEAAQGKRKKAQY